MATKTATASEPLPLSEQILAAEAEADRLRAEQRAALAAAEQLAAEKATRELEAEKAWAERQHLRMRAIFRKVEELRLEAVTKFEADDPGAHGAWVAWRSEAISASQEWSIIKRSYDKTHPGQPAPAGRDYRGASAGTIGETWAVFAHDQAIRVGNARSVARRAAVLADLAAAVGTADVAKVEAGLSPVARFARFQTVPHMGAPGADVTPMRQPAPGAIWLADRIKVEFGPDGTAAVYDEAIAAELDGRADCVRLDAEPDEDVTESL